MNDHDARRHDLLFLLGLAPLAMGCSVGVPDNGSSFTSAPYGGNGTSMDSADDSEATSEGSGAMDETGGTSGASATTTTTTAGDSITITASAGSNDGSASASATVTASAGDDSMTGPPPPGTACEAYGYLLAGCYAGGDPTAAANYTYYCESYGSYLYVTFGAACGAAYEDFVACINTLQCLDLPSIGMPGYCDAQLTAAQAACN